MGTFGEVYCHLVDRIQRCCQPDSMAKNYLGQYASNATAENYCPRYSELSMKIFGYLVNSYYKPIGISIGIIEDLKNNMKSVAILTVKDFFIYLGSLYILTAIFFSF